VFVYVCVFFCVCVQVEALRRADHTSKESYRLSLIKKLRKLSPMLQKREQAPKCGSNEEEKKRVIIISIRLSTGYDLKSVESSSKTPIMKSSVFWDITQCSPSKVIRRFGEPCCLHLQCRRINQKRSQRCEDSNPTLILFL
jgi:hypothetical protein